jgi:hypothetical protein
MTEVEGTAFHTNHRGTDRSRACVTGRLTPGNNAH